MNNKILPTLDGLKLLAKYIKNKDNISHTEAIQNIATKLGYSTSNALYAAIKEKSSDSFDYMFSGDIYDLLHPTQPVTFKQYCKSIYQDLGNFILEDEVYNIFNNEMSDNDNLKMNIIKTSGLEYSNDEVDDTYITYWVSIFTDDKILATTRIVTITTILCENKSADCQNVELAQEYVDEVSPNYTYPYIMECLASYSLQNSETLFKSEAIIFCLFDTKSFYVKNNEDTFIMAKLIFSQFFRSMSHDEHRNFIFGMEIEASLLNSNIQEKIKLYNTLAMMNNAIKEVPRETGISKMSVFQPDVFSLDYDALNYIAMTKKIKGRKFSNYEVSNMLKQVEDTLDAE